jgi:cyanophycinase
MHGPVALVGAGEFLPGMVAVDRALLDATGRSRPRVAIVPTASWPDGETAFLRWAAMGEAHFGALGAEVEAVLIRDRAEADDPGCLQALGEADLIYLSGGKPDYLLATLEGTEADAAIRRAYERGAALAGCSAGAMVLAGRLLGAGLRRPRLPFLARWHEALGIVPGTAVLPHYDAFPETLAALLVLRAPRGTVVLGIDGETAAVGRDDAWQVHGRGRVTVWRGRRRERHRDGETFRL